jgi:hypothetical protein
MRSWERGDIAKVYSPRTYYLNGLSQSPAESYNFETGFESQRSRRRRHSEEKEDASREPTSVDDSGSSSETNSSSSENKSLSKQQSSTKAVSDNDAASSTSSSSSSSTSSTYNDNDDSSCSREFEMPLFYRSEIIRHLHKKGGIKCAIVCTYTLDIKEMNSEIPELFADNATVPVLFMHSDQTLRTGHAAGQQVCNQRGHEGSNNPDKWKITFSNHVKCVCLQPK